MVNINIKLSALICDPLEQFEVSNYECIFFTNVHYYALCICFILACFLFFTGGFVGYNSRKPNLVLFRDKTFRFITYLIKENLNIKIVIFFPIIYLTFLFLLIANLVGMLPYSFTITSSAAVAFFFSIMFFVGITLIGYSTHKDAFFQILLPAGVPLVLAPFLVVLEAISYFVKVFSLAGRLFANMLAGHGLLKVLGSMGTAIFSHGAGPVPFYCFPLGLVLLVTFLEVAVAFLQAYVFIVLICVYLNDAISIH
jgi:ATP synthase subunit 6